jgi:hypothetical protein
MFYVQQKKFYVQRVGIVPRTIRKAAHSGNAPYISARRHSGVVLAGIQEKLSN